MADRVRRAMDAFNRGDFEAAMGYAHPDIVFARPGVESELSGAAAIRAWMEPDAFESQKFELVDFRASGNRLLVRQRMRARGTVSGIEMEVETLTVWTFDEAGRATRMESFRVEDESDALRALEGS